MAEPEPPGEEDGAEPSGFAEERFLEALSGWAAGQRVAGAASGRARLRALTEAAAGSATLAGILVDLAERQAEVAVVCAGPAPGDPPARGAAGSGRLTGRLVGVGRDFVVVEQRDRPPVVVRTGALCSVWPLPGTGGGGDGAGGWFAGPGRGDVGSGISLPGGDRTAPLALSLDSVLAELAAERAPVAVGTPAGRIEGELVAVGRDVVTLRAPGPARRLVHVPAGSLQWCELR